MDLEEFCIRSISIEVELFTRAAVTLKLPAPEVFATVRIVAPGHFVENELSVAIVQDPLLLIIISGEGNSHVHHSFVVELERIVVVEVVDRLQDGDVPLVYQHVNPLIRVQYSD